jgi:energy-coupling factor transport system ATP-binding protein
MQKIIEIKNATYNYKDYTENGTEIATDRGVNDVSLDVYEGEFLALVGHNGSGKSTLAKLFNGLIKPQSGFVRVYGLNPEVDEELYKIRSKVGMVFQNPDNQMVASIVEDDVAFGPENLGIETKELRARVDNALKSVNMYEYAEKTPTRLSGGQKQRIAIAGALAIQPQVLVLDEATSMLDPIGRQEVMDTVFKLNKEGITVIAITHFMDEAVKADRVVVLNEGKIALEGTPKEVFSQGRMLHQMGLDVPRSVSLSTQLSERGFDVQPFTTDIKLLGDKLCQLLSKI